MNNPLLDTLTQLERAHAENLLDRGDLMALRLDLDSAPAAPSPATIELGATTLLDVMAIDGHRDSLWLYLVGAELLNGEAA